MAAGVTGALRGATFVMEMAETSISGAKSNMKGPSRPRRTQEQRSADTRRALIDAAIECIQTYGYAGTNTTMIAARAGVSRGAMTHQFPTKIDLMKAVVGHGYSADISGYAESIAKLSQKDAFFQIARLGWDAYRQSASIAVTEIMMATRSDRKLARELQVLQGQIERDARERLIGLLGRAGHIPRSDFGAMHRLLTASLRGLAMDAMFIDQPVEIEGAVDLLGHLLRLLYPTAED
jgi:AcrR family transcriptional regulator